MRSYAISLLAFFLVWNSVLGVVDGLMLCMHDEGGGHVELLEAETAADHEHGHAKPALSGKSCPPCVDVVYRPIDLDLSPSSDALGLKVPSFSATTFAESKPNEFFKPEAPVALENPTRGPPAVEPVCELIRRTCVLRI